MELPLILLGFLAGMGHALEPDHLAAVGTLATGGNSRRSLVLRGALWGLGHTITLFVICTAVIVFGMTLTDRMAAILESVVGIMLMLLGAEVLWRLRKARIHIHAHDHEGGKRHFHAHSHVGETVPHSESRHAHRDRGPLPVKALLVGLVHGAAGSAGLLALAIATVPDPLRATAYVLLFGLGSLVGMASLSLVASGPLVRAERAATRLYRAASAAVGWIGIAIGVHVLTANATLAWSGPKLSGLQQQVHGPHLVRPDSAGQGEVSVFRPEHFYAKFGRRPTAS